MAQSKKKGAPKNSSNIFIGVGALIAVLLLFAFLKPDVTELQSNGHDKDAGSDEVEIPNTAKNFDLIHQDSWDRLEGTVEDLQDLGEGQYLTYGMIEDPTDKNILYFVTSTIAEVDEKENLVSIYKYSKDDYSFERLYKKIYKRGDWKQIGPVGEEEFSKRDVIFMGVRGYDSGSLVLTVGPIVEECGPTATCIYPSDSIKMDLDNPYGGFEAYEYNEE